MKTYIEAVLQRLENAIEGNHKVTPRTFSPGDYVGIMVMLVEHKHNVLGVRGDLFNAFIEGTCEKHLKQLKVNMGLTFLEFVEEVDGHYIAQSCYDEALWKEMHGDQPPPPAPAFRLKKRADTVKFDYNQVQNFIWESVDDHPANPVPFGENSDCYLDIEYFIRVLLSDTVYFQNSVNHLLAYLLHYANESDEWIKEVHARLVKMHYSTLFFEKEIKNQVQH